MFNEVWNRPMMMFNKSWDTSETGMAETGRRKQVVVIVQRRREWVVGTGCQHTKTAETGCRNGLLSKEAGKGR